MRNAVAIVRIVLRSRRTDEIRAYRGRQEKSIGIIKFRFKRRNTRLINPLPAGTDTGFTTVIRTRIYVLANGYVLFLPRPITVVVGGPFRIRFVRIEHFPLRLAMAITQEQTKTTLN